ncbi:polysaccharide pyruvyl transferase family protein [Alteromonas facilis]|uniref:polysaccharide pyruvyl transferase family protein n=1 Tax=Alteromonas facilis TaxID=2048004 RepID=UPI000C282D54|nr:polysaccharide pyruvyl transferase family protein [Alteromonas facilis]
MIKKYDAYVVGYYGMQNSGDDALLAASLLGSEHYLGIKSTLISHAGPLSRHRFGERRANLTEDQRFPGQNRLSHYINAAQCKRVIFGGGSVLHSQQDINIKRTLMHLTSSTRSMALGVGIEPFKSDADQLACTKFLNQCGIVAVRDSDSFKLAKSIAPHANVVESFDLAPLLLTHKEFHRFSGKRRGVVVNVCPAPVSAMGNTNAQNETKRLMCMAEIIHSIWELSGEPISLMVFNGHDRLGDVRVTQQLHDLLAERLPLNIIPYNPDPIQVLNQIGQFKLMLGMRLHANIFAYLSHTPSINLGYHPKSHSWAEQVGLSPDYQFNANSIDRVRLFNSAMNALSTGHTGTKLSTDQALQQSIKNWSHSYETCTDFSGYPTFQQRKAHTGNA